MYIKRSLVLETSDLFIR